MGAILIAATVLATALWFLMADSIFECEVTQHAALLSPDGSKAAVMYDVDCDATTGFNTQVAITPANSAFDRTATPSFLVIGGRWGLPMRWIDERTLYIQIPKTERYYRKLTSAGDVTVVYEEEDAAR